MLNLKQLLAGIAASALVIAVSLGFISLFDAPKFIGLVSFCLISVSRSYTFGTQCSEV